MFQPVIIIPKEGYKRIGFEIPESLHKRYTAYNETAIRPINLARLVSKTLEEELDKAEG